MTAVCLVRLKRGTELWGCVCCSATCVNVSPYGSLDQVKESSKRTSVASAQESTEQGNNVGLL
jgi:hypothetical protein